MKTEEFYNSLDDSSKKWLQNLMKLLRGDTKMGNNNQNGNFGVNNINININMNNNMSMGMPMDMNNNGNMNNNLNIPPNMMILNQMNLQPNQGYMMPQQTNIGDFNFPMYNENYLNNIYMGNQGANNGFNNMNYYGNYQK
jgi:hypothetical protein